MVAATEDCEAGSAGFEVGTIIILVVAATEGCEAESGAATANMVLDATAGCEVAIGGG